MRDTDEPSEQKPLPEKKPEKTINKRLQRTQAQVNEVVDIMRVSIEKVLERDKHLSQLDDRADALQAGASQFEASAGKLKRKFWWRNCKLLMILCGLLAVVAILIIVAVTSGKNESTNLGENQALPQEPSELQPDTQQPGQPSIPNSETNPIHERGQEELPSWQSHKPSTVQQQAFNELNSNKVNKKSAWSSNPLNSDEQKPGHRPSWGASTSSSTKMHSTLDVDHSL